MIDGADHISKNPQSTTKKAVQVKRRKFFVISPDYRGGGKGHGIDIVNESALRTPGMMGFYPPRGRRGFVDPLPETPHARQGKGFRAVRDLESLGRYWMASQRTKEVFESVDPGGVAFVPCDFTLPDGSKGDQRYLCDVIRELDAIDEEKSKVKVEYEGEWKAYNPMGGASIVFDEERTDDAHVFKQIHLGGLICDDVLRDACRSAKLTGILFRDAADL
ncbi:DUF1629 domain-containing protein [Phyllobacterium sp. 0TCS1.6C]|uniref:imm11 family protein n=1 Tax=unclassified Phyllobacterium TaxID=2638441 RepID=UPI002263B207|nr:MULTISPECIES: DUF1629 domain-containing protein [unclassified Phyllobacterium]MCX8281899.1 DUF1629 domain-containing protein [Phyllobacterium sp. 0TCS1.6C]MCX8295434.1 DUF1629 domain-containing protein [Phyllobacterium sp. 0TCS1.6A]